VGQIRQYRRLGFYRDLNEFIVSRFWMGMNGCDEPYRTTYCIFQGYPATTFMVPELPLLIVSDATPEALGLRLAEQGERLAVFDAEGGGLSR